MFWAVFVCVTFAVVSRLSIASASAAVASQRMNLAHERCCEAVKHLPLVSSWIFRTMSSQYSGLWEASIPGDGKPDF